MIKTTSAFLKEINKLGGRKFVSKVLIRDKEYNDDNIIDMSLNESVNPGDNFSLGSVVSNTFEINLIDIDTNVIFEDATVKPYIGLELDTKIEYIPLGVFTVDEVSKKDKKVKLQCVDNMLNLERAYFSKLSYPTNINSILKEICSKSKITCNSTLPNYSIEEIKGYSLRQAIGIIATLCGCFARFNRMGELEILTYTEVGLKITPDIYFTFENDNKEYRIEKITAKRGEKTFSKGVDIGREIQIDNPVITEDILNDLYTKYKDFSYMPYSLKWQGNPAVQAGDRVTIVDLEGKVYNTLIMEHKLTFKGSISSELKATGKTESSDKFDSKGSIAQAMENYSIEQAAIKVALIQKADIDEFNALNGRVNTLYTEDLTSLKANIKDLQSNKISTIEFNALESKLQTALIGKADVNELNVAVERVGIIEGKTAAIENMFNKNITSKNIATGAITANSGIIAEGAIGDAEISSLSGNKLRFGTIDTSLVSILGPDGRLRLQGNKLQVFDNSNGKLFERVMLGVDDNNNSSLILRGADGKTVLLNQDGLTKEGITEGFGKVDDNSLDAKKFDKNSLVREVNGATETIKGTRVQIGDRTLDVELSTQKNTITKNGKELSTQKAIIKALDNAIKLKVDNQTFNQTTNAIKGNLNSLNSNLLSKINTSLNDAKAYTTAEIRTVNTNLSKAAAEISILQNEIKSKVSQNDVDRSISNIKIGGRNLIRNSNLANGLSFFNINNSNGNGSIELVNFQNRKCLKFINISSYRVSKYLRFIAKGFKKGNNVSVGVDVYIINGDGLCFDTSYNLGVEYLNVDFIEKNKWVRLTKTSSKKTTEDGDISFALYGKGETPISGYLTFFKVEEGNKATDWTPAPEDTDQLIADNIKVVTEKINTIESTFKQAKDSLQASVNSLNSTTQTITTNLTNTTNNLNGKIDTVNTRVSNAESSLNILKGQISSKVSQSDIDRTVNNIKFNDANMLYNSGNFKDTTYWSCTNGTENFSIENGILKFKFKDYSSWGCYVDNWSLKSQPLDISKEYTVVCKLKASRNQIVGFNICDGNGYNFVFSKDLNITTEWQIFKFTFKPKVIGNERQFRFITKNLGYEIDLYIEFVKMVEGATSSDVWTSNPYEVNKDIKDNMTILTEKINTVESTFTQKTNNINAAVSSVQSILNKKADGSTVSSIQSQLSSLNIGVNGIRTEVAKKTDKNNIISAINQSAEEIKIDASRIKINGLTTFASRTGLKAIEIESNNIIFYDWEGSERKDSVGMIYSTRGNGDVRKPGLAIGHEEGAMFDIVCKDKKTKKYQPYINFDKYNIGESIFPITLYEDISLNGYVMYLGDTKRNYMYQSRDGDFCIRTAHGLKILDKDNGSYTADLDANYTGFGKWNQDFFYAKFFPGGFDFVGNDGKSLFWLNDGSWDIWTKKGVNMRIQGSLSVNGKKNRIVETSIGDLALNAIESAECWFTDNRIEQNRTDAKGDCIIWFDNKFLLTVNTKYRYKIDLTPLGEFASNGKLTYVRVVEKTEKYFKVRGTPNTLFDWTITAKQIGYENVRLEKVEKAS